MKDVRHADTKIWNCRTSCTTSERRHFVRIGSVWTARELVGRSHGALFQTLKLCMRKMTNNARRQLDTRIASAMPCKVTKPANPNGSSWIGPCASDWSGIEAKRLNSSCAKQDRENIIMKSQSIRTTKSKERIH